MTARRPLVNLNGQPAELPAGDTLPAGILTPAAATDIWVGTDTGKALTAKALWDARAFVALTDAATIAVNLSTFLNASVTLGGNRTLAAAANAKAGQSGVILIRQDATGGRSLAFDGSWDFGAAGAPTLSAAAGSVDMLSYFVVDPAAPLVRAVFWKQGGGFYPTQFFPPLF